MTKEDKQLLLIDLCARLPYGVMIEGLEHPEVMTIKHLAIISAMPAEPYKPYLRPMSSMTEEEKEEIACIRNRDFQSVRKWFNEESIKETGNICPITCGENDYCNKKHFDYRTDDEGKTMIEKGLALEAPEGMYDIK